MLTTLQAAAKLKCSRRRVLELIAAKRLKATRYGLMWMIDPADLAAVRDRKPGRPKATRKGT